VVRPIAGLRVNNGVFIRDAALAGLGVALVPPFIVAQELRSGALKALNVDYEPDAPTSISRTRATVSHRRSPSLSCICA
jgi:DNA-binding transcriptional LysR family regulator